MANPNGQQPHFPGGVRVGIGSSMVITGGVAVGSVAIIAEVGTLPAGSIYISQGNGTGAIWIMQGTTWTQLTVN